MGSSIGTLQEHIWYLFEIYKKPSDDKKKISNQLHAKHEGPTNCK